MKNFEISLKSIFGWDRWKISLNIWNFDETAGLRNNVVSTKYTRCWSEVNRWCNHDQNRDQFMINDYSIDLNLLLTMILIACLVPSFISD